MESQRYMLDTNMASYIIKGKPVAVKEHLLNVPMASICISAITEAELLHGVVRKPEAKHLPLIGCGSIRSTHSKLNNFL